MRNVATHVGTVVAGVFLPVVEAIFGFAALPLLVLLDGVGVLPNNQSIMWFFWMMPILLIGLVLGHEGQRVRSWRSPILLALGLLISAPLFAWLMTDDVQAGIQMEPGWVHDEYMQLLRHMLWNSLAGVATLFAGNWLGGLVARVRSRRNQPQSGP